jgi:hypothetical protein
MDGARRVSEHSCENLLNLQFYGVGQTVNAADDLLIGGLEGVVGVAKQPQTNPPLDNEQGLAVVTGRQADTGHEISDDNFGATQITRVLTRSAKLPY